MAPSPLLRSAVRPQPLDVGALIAEAGSPQAGAIVVFLGTARDHSPGKEGITHLEYEAYPEHVTMPHVELFTDRFVCAVDAANAEVGDAITLEQFGSLPYLAGSCGHQVSPAEAQLDALGVHRNVEMTTAYGLAPLLLAGTGMVALIHERLAEAVGARASLRLLDPPLPLEPIHEVLMWSSGTDTDPGLQWLRSRMMAVAAELDADRRAGAPAGSIA